MKTETVTVEGYWQDEPSRIFMVLVALGKWDGVEDETDRNIFYYMDGEPLSVGDTIAEDFIVTEILK